MDTDVQHLLTHGYIIRYYDKIGYSHNTSLYLTHKAKEILEKDMFVKQSFLYYKRENLLFAELNETQKDIIAKTLAWGRVLRLEIDSSNVILLEERGYFIKEQFKSSPNVLPTKKSINLLETDLFTKEAFIKHQKNRENEINNQHDDLPF